MTASIVLFMSGTLIGMLIGLVMERQARPYYLERDRAKRDKH